MTLNPAPIFRGELHTTYYDALATAFLHGHLSLPNRPSPRLLSLTDPYDPVQNSGLREPDLSLYHGDYYLYFGPASTLAILPLKALGVPLVPDAAAVFIWSAGLAVVLALFFAFFTDSERVAALPGVVGRHAAPFPASVLMAGYVCTALNIGILSCVARPTVYEAAITGGAFFFWTGITAALYALAADRPADGTFRLMLLGLSGSAFALSVLSRSTYLFAVGLAVLLICHALRRQRVGRRASGLCCLGLPLLLGASFFFWYNYERFGSVLETGFRYQLNNQRMHALAVSGKLFHARYVLTNLWEYFLHPLHYGFHPVFVLSTAQESPPPSWIRTPAEYQVFGHCDCDAAGILWHQCTIYVAAILAVFSIRSRQRRSRASSVRQVGSKLGLLFLAVCAVQMLPLLFLYASALRYEADFLIALSIALTFLCAALVASTASRIAAAFAFTALTANAVFAFLYIALWRLSESFPQMFQY